MPAGIGAAIMEMSVAISAAIKKQLKPVGLNIIQSNGAAAGQVILLPTKEANMLIKKKYAEEVKNYRGIVIKSKLAGSRKKREKHKKNRRKENLNPCRLS